ncbi:hypothetical protein BU17DRAFT_76474 [Hysterangium stoloniferum]|nr:hypothetical protein BU17DRAFT_76474 [Hysterangium stoloniferum]
MACNGAFDTRAVRPWNQPRPQTSQVIQFSTPFECPPSLALGLSVLDIQNVPDPRVTVYATDVTDTSASFHANSEEGSTLYTATTNWFGVDPRDPDFQIGEFSTTQVHPRNKPQVLTSCRITFARPFVEVPKVISVLREFHFSKDHGWRITTEVSHINCNGFTIHIKSWADTIIYSATASWIAYSPSIGDVYSGSVNTMDAHAWTQPKAQTSKAVEFQGMTFTKVPNVFFGLYSLDMSSDRNLRIKCTMDNVGRKGFTWHIDTWANSVIWSAGISYLCFERLVGKAILRPR